jgi:orotidine-5'-phosphate decarboxylase
MTKPIEAASPISNIRDRIIVALDVDSAAEAREIARELQGRVGAFKVGLQLFTVAGPEFVRELVSSAVNVFLDLKFHDIPNTVAKASIEAARLGVWMFNVHASGGSEMMRQAVDEVTDACNLENLRRPLIIGVTVLTSSDRAVMTEIGVEHGVENQVVRLAQLADASGLDGVVASAQEVASIRTAVPNSKFLTITPGIRPISATQDDQKRVTTLGQGLAKGSDYVVIGRPITRATDRIEALEQIVSEI